MAEIAALAQKGWDFPPVFNSASRRMPVQTGLDNLAKCLKIMLATQPGERNQHFDYGSDLSQFAFQRMSIELLEVIEEIVGDSIENHEPRIGIRDVVVGPDPSNRDTVIVQVEYNTKEGAFGISQIPLNLNVSLPVGF